MHKYVGKPHSVDEGELLGYRVVYESRQSFCRGFWGRILFHCPSEDKTCFDPDRSHELASRMFNELVDLELNGKIFLRKIYATSEANIGDLIRDVGELSLDDEMRRFLGREVALISLDPAYMGTEFEMACRLEEALANIYDMGDEGGNYRVFGFEEELVDCRLPNPDSPFQSPIEKRAEKPRLILVA